MSTPSPVPGLFTLVLHSHLPWLPHHGRWPVGEEWLYQSWSGAYLPVLELLDRLRASGRGHLLTLGVTPVLAASLDDPSALAGMHTWLGDWQLRAHEAADASSSAVRDLAADEHRRAAHALELFESRWRSGGSPVLRTLVDAETIELLSGPLTHPFQPLIHPRLREVSLRAGLADTGARIGSVPQGIWAPECGYTPGLERLYARSGVTHFMVDGPALHGDTALGRPVADSDVVAFGRDLTVSYRVWSPKSGYPGAAEYRDFHTYDHDFGLKLARVTGKQVPPEQKAPYEPARIPAAVERDAQDFVAVVARRLRDESERLGRPAHVVAAFDTELFGHWWFEGPAWLERVLTLLPAIGVRVGTLADAARDGFVGEPVQLGDSSWGSGKDWRVWAGPQVADLLALNTETTETALAALDAAAAGSGPVRTRDAVADQLLRETILTVASDWAFMVSKQSAEGYARDRAHQHAHAVRELAQALRAGPRSGADEAAADRLAGTWRRADSPFGALDARLVRPLDPADPPIGSL